MNHDIYSGKGPGEVYGRDMPGTCASHWPAVCHDVQGVSPVSADVAKLHEPVHPALAASSFIVLVERKGKNMERAARDVMTRLGRQKKLLDNASRCKTKG